MSNTLKRIVVAIFLTFLFLFLFISDILYGILFLIMVIAFSFIGSNEFYHIAKRNDGEKPSLFWLYFSAIYFPISFYLEHSVGAFFFVISIFVGFLVIFIGVSFYRVFFIDIKGAIYSISTTLFGAFYVSFLGSFILLYKYMENALFYVVFLAMITFLTDSGGYFGGLWFGKHKLNFRVSPNKTLEGYITGILCGILGGVVSYLFFGSFGSLPFSLSEGVLISIFFSFSTAFGDLVESLLKRDGGVKDSSRIIPGHGGVLDLLDAFIFNLPLFYVYISIKGALG